MSVISSTRLVSLGIEIDPSPAKFGWLRESTLDSEPGAMRMQLGNEGYLYLRDFWPRHEVQRARDSITGQLAALGFIRSDRPLDEAWGVQGREAGRAMGHPLDQHDPVVRELLFGRRIIGFFESLLGGDVRGLDFIWYRTKDRGHGSPAHCDLVYMGRGTHNLFTAWVPIGDVPVDLGGLIVLEGSHTRSEELSGYLARDVDAFCTNRTDAVEYATGKKWWDGTLSKNVASLQESLGGRWLTSPEYRMGDVLVFNMTLVHASLDNHTECVRISTDTRYQLACEPADERWIGPNPPGHAQAMRKGRVC